MKQFVHLHLHTQYSLLDGVNKIGQVIETASSFGQPAIAITDHGNMHGAMEFYYACKQNKIKPIIGCEAYLNPVSRHERLSRQQGGAPTNHLTILAKNQKGYQNLCRLISLAYKEGFYFKPRIDSEILEECREGLIILSGCLSSEVGGLISQDQDDLLKEKLEWYARTFKDDYYLEVQPHPIPEQQKQNQVLAEYAKSLGIPLVASTDCHYPAEDYHYAQEVLMCISTGKQVDDPTRLRHEGVKLHLKTVDEMYTEFTDLPYVDEAIQNTVAIADKVNLDFEFNTYYMPHYATEQELSLSDCLRADAKSGLERRLKKIKEGHDWNNSKLEIYNDRLEEELDILINMGFPGYFLVVADFINWAKEQGIPVGPGRGSAAGSLVAYAMRITEVDPIEHKLLFERFLNPERVSMPDIDVDFCITGRDAVINYVVEKYGADRVAQIVTFGTLKAKAVIKDVGRALGMTFAETDRIAKLIPAPRQGFDYPIAESLKMEPKLAQYAKEEGREHIDLAQRLEGLNRHVSTHAAGVVIGDRPLSELLPMMVDKDGNDVTQFSMKYVEKIGLVKFDFLGLKTLTVIQTAIDIIKHSQGIELDANDFPIDDAKTFTMLCAGNTTGVFQLESTGITDMTMRLKPNCFADLVAILALYRPGPLDAGMVDHYINRKHGRESVEYLHPEMKSILQNTYGIIVYQEQIMQLAQALAGYSLGDADLLRRAMGKKVPEEMAKQRTRFMDGATANKLDQGIAKEIFDQMETFARYGFNKSHSVAYALISYQTGYLRAHYPVEFLAALMSHEIDDSDKVLKNMNECRKLKIKVLPPDVNKSQSGFSVEGKCIRFGMSAVKGVGEKVVEELIKERVENGSYLSLEDLVTRVEASSLNKRVLENLVKCGAFDFTDLSRAELFERVEPVLKAGQSLHKQKNTNQMSLFSSEEMSKSIPQRNSNRSEWPVNQRLYFERDALGFYLSGHPIEKFEHYLKVSGVKTISELQNMPSTKEVQAGGVVTAVNLKNTKKGQRYCSFIFEDTTGTIDAIVWPDSYLKISQTIHGEDPVIARGRLEKSDERSTYFISEMESLIDVRDRRARFGLLSFTAQDRLVQYRENLMQILAKYPGDVPLKAAFDFPQEKIILLLKNKEEVPVTVKPSEALCEEVEELFGRPVLIFT